MCNKTHHKDPKLYSQNLLIEATAMALDFCRTAISPTHAQANLLFVSPLDVWPSFLRLKVSVVVLIRCS